MHSTLVPGQIYLDISRVYTCSAENIRDPFTFIGYNGTKAHLIKAEPNHVHNTRLKGVKCTEKRLN